MSFDFDDFDVRSRFCDIDEKTDEVKALLRDLPDETDEIRDRCQIAYIYHDCALDGVVVGYPELRAAVDRKVMSDVALIPAYQEIKNQVEGLRNVEQASQAAPRHQRRTTHSPVHAQWMYELHHVLLRDLPRKTPGMLRTDMPLHRTYFHDIADPSRIEAGLEETFELAQSADFRSQHAINQASLFHVQFMRVFPFAVGSGIVGRWLMNYFLMSAGYMPAVIHASDRQRYYESLRDGPGALRDLLLDSMDAALEATSRHLKDRLRQRHAPPRRASLG